MAGPLVAIVGETGSGKSDLAMRIAEEFNGEIICADAWTVRKGMDIGTAKPTEKDRQAVPHHLLNLVEPNEAFSAAEFQRQASVVINAIHKRHKLPIIVGGSGLYIDSILYNYSFLTTDSTITRKQLNNMNVDELLSFASKEQISIDGIDTSNKRRLIRLIETRGEKAHKKALSKETLIIGIQIEKDELEHKLRERLNKMLEDNLETEVRDLSLKYSWETEALKGVGYSEWQDYFAGSINKSELTERIIKDSLYLAKKQRTWFKRNKDIHWLTTPVEWHEVVDLLTTTSLTAV